MDTIVADRRGASDVAAPLEIGSVALAVRDIERVAAFYRSALGLAPVAQSGDTVALGAGGTAFLTLQHRPDMKPGDRASAGLFHVAYLLPNRVDLGRWLRHAGRSGLSLDGAADHLVSEAVYLHDPEGNGIEVYVDRPRVEWNWQGGQVMMANDRLHIIGLQALAQEDWAGAPHGTRIGHVHLQVGAIPAAEEFYAGILGFDVTRRWPQASFMSTGGYHHHIAANTWNSAGAGARDPDRAGLASVTLRAASPSIVAAIAGRAGGEAQGLRDPWGTTIHVISQEGSVS